MPKTAVLRNNSDKKEVELSMNETETASTDPQTGKDDLDSEDSKNKPHDGNKGTDLKFPKLFGTLFVILMIVFIGGIFGSVVFFIKICVLFANSLNTTTCIQLPACVGCKTVVNNSANIVACIQCTVSLALVLAAVIITSISLIKTAKWLIKVDVIKQVLNSSCNAEQKKQFCDTLADL